MASSTPTSTTTTIIDLHMSFTDEEKSDDIINSMVISKGAHRPAVVSCTNEKALRFGNVSIREYPVIVGDNPGGISGPPLSIGWEYYDEMTVDLISYEEQRPPRRQGREMLVPVDVRFQRLRTAGYSRSEIVALTKPVNVARTQRRRTLDTLHLQPIQMFNERFAKKTMSLITGGRRKRHEKKLMQSFDPEASPAPSPASSQASKAPRALDDDQSTDENCLSLQSVDEISPTHSHDSEITI